MNKKCELIAVGLVLRCGNLQLPKRYLKVASCFSVNVFVELMLFSVALVIYAVRMYVTCGVHSNWQHL